MKKYFLLVLLVISISAKSQIKSNHAIANAWADSVLKSLTKDQRIAQLMVLRLTSMDPQTKMPIYYDSLVGAMVQKYNIGGVCLFQGGPVMQGTTINNLQRIAQTPILVSIDAEWGVGMRLFDSVQALPHQMMLGAMQDSNIIYQYGKLVGEQCKRLGIHVNFAPVVDVNNNPNNPVINDRSFGEDKYKVALFGIQYMKGMQDIGILACAKHFPGHGDVEVDSHKDLPIINKSMVQLDSLELYPFRKIFEAGVGSVMIAHLYIPAIDTSANRATSISKNNVTGLLRNKLDYQGLTFTDALEMQGVKKYFPDGEAAVQSIIAGNDMLCLPGDVEQVIEKIKTAIDNKLISWDEIDEHCKKVLLAKYKYIGVNSKPVVLSNIAAELNNGIPAMKKLVAENAITVLNKTDNDFFPLIATNEIAYVGIGLDSSNAFARNMTATYKAATFYFNYKTDTGSIAAIIDSINSKYKKVVIGIHGYSRTPFNNFGISAAATQLIQQLQQQTNSISFVFGNPYAIKNYCNAANLVACYEDDTLTQQAAFDLLQGKIAAKGKLPVTVCDAYKYGSGINTTASFLPPKKAINYGTFNAIDSIANNAITSGATPGCVVLAAKDGKIVYHKAFGNFNYDGLEKTAYTSVYDMASVTKICATTLTIMKLYEEGKIDLKQTLGHYLPSAKGTNKENLTIENILLHQAGLIAYIPFYREIVDSAGNPMPHYFSAIKNDTFSIRVAENLYLRNSWNDSMMSRILRSSLSAPNKYVYSDNDFIFLGKISEAIDGMPLNEYVETAFYTPLGLTSTGFKPRDHMSLNRIVPTEQEPIFRKQLVRGDVHDPGAAMFGGVAGHAGLFSNAYDLAVIMQMLLNGGTFNGKRYLKKETIDLFTGYHSTISRRGYGFDKPEKDNRSKPEPYPSYSSSPLTFGHTGFTGTCVWADPANNLVFVFLSNRVTPDGNSPILSKLNVRPAILEAIYVALGIDAKK
jgi:beta-glucosidase-like glycosyl hydrolase/CubicO group peptidase (beta-lactamase class C family)